MEHYLAINPTTHSTICVFCAEPPFTRNGDGPTIEDVETPDSQAWAQLQYLARQGKDIRTVKIPRQIKGECERLLNTVSSPDAYNDPLVKFSEEIRRYHTNFRNTDDHLKPRTSKAIQQGRRYSTERLGEEIQDEIIKRIRKGQSKAEIARAVRISRSSVYRYWLS